MCTLTLAYNLDSQHMAPIRIHRSGLATAPAADLATTKALLHPPPSACAPHALRDNGKGTFF